MNHTCEQRDTYTQARCAKSAPFYIREAARFVCHTHCVELFYNTTWRGFETVEGQPVTINRATDEMILAEDAAE